MAFEVHVLPYSQVSMDSPCSSTWRLEHRTWLEETARSSLSPVDWTWNSKTVTGTVPGKTGVPILAWLLLALCEATLVVHDNDEDVQITDVVAAVAIAVGAHGNNWRCYRDRRHATRAVR